MPELKAHGEGRTTRRCPACGSRHGRVGIDINPAGGKPLRGWLCFDCGYFPGKDIKKCLIEKAIREMEEEGIILQG